MNNDLISRAALLAAYDATHKGPPGEARKLMEDAPAVDAAPVVHGRWVMKHVHRGGMRRYTGFDDFGEEHTINVDERVEYDDRYCSECGKQSADNFLNFCPYCGAKMNGGATK